jgi:hypothetical protein
MMFTRQNRTSSPLRGVHWIELALAVTALVGVLGFQASAETQPPDSALGPPPGSYTIFSGGHGVAIPFEVYRGDIRMAAEINGRPVRMMLDNGNMWDQLLVFGSARIDSLDLHYDGEEEVGGPGAGSPVEARTASGIAITFPGIEFTDQTAIVTPESSGLTRMWEGTEGQVSATFLKHFVTSIDFDNNLITLTEPSAFEYKGGGVEVPLKPLEDGAWGIPGTVVMSDGRRVSLDLMLDLGYSDEIQIVTGGPHGFDLPEKTIEVSLGFGVQGEIRGHLGRVRSIEIGGYAIDDALAGFVPAADSAPAYDEAMIGLGLLSRFNIVFDYPGRRMFLEPGRTYSEPYEYDMSGMWLRPARGGYWEVERVLEGSPAADAGIEAGDSITRINGNPAGDYAFWDLIPMMRQAGDTLQLEILRDGRSREAAIVLRRVI